MASNIERLTIKDTFTSWRDKINLLIDVAVLAPMADEDGIMHIDIPHCNAREVRFGVPVKLESDAWARELHCDGSISSAASATTIQETANAGLKMIETEGYIPWVSGRTQNGTASLWTSSYDDLIHFSYVDIDGEIVNTLSWDPNINSISAKVDNAVNAEVADLAKSLKFEDQSEARIPGSYPVSFGKINEDGIFNGLYDGSFAYNPRIKELTCVTFKGNLDGSSKHAEKTDKLSQKRTISLGIDASGEMEFDGSENVILPCKLNATGVVPNLYGPSGNVYVPRSNRRFTIPAFRVDEKGRIIEAYTRTVEFPYPEVDIDNELNENSLNPIANKPVAEKFAEVEARFEDIPDKSPATVLKDGLMSRDDKIKLNSLSQFPRIDSIEVQNYDTTTEELISSFNRTISTSKTTCFAVAAKNGLEGSLDVADAAAGSTILLNLGFNLNSIAGDGIIEADGKLAVPVYAGPDMHGDGIPGLVPSASNEESGLFLNGAGQWAAPVGTTYLDATSSASGLMSAEDKMKLDGIATQATKVSFSSSLSTGTKIGTLEIDGTETDIYCEKNTDTTYVGFGGATASEAGNAGLVPAPSKGGQSKYLRGDATWQTVYDAVQVDAKLNAKASLDSPAFTGTPTSSTPAAGDNTKKIATTAWVQTYCNTTKKYLTAHQSLSSCVKTSGEQVIIGQKTFDATIKSGAGDVISGKENDGMVRINGGTTSVNGGHLVLWGSSHSDYPGCFNITAQKGIGSTARILSGKPDGTLTWKGNSIQVTSDEKLKTPLKNVPNEVLDAWEAVQWGQYQFKDALKEKEGNARLHVGLIAQQVQKAFELRGLDACQYGILCNEDGLWMIRYQEANAMETACLRRRISQLEQRLATLEKKA